MIRAGRVLNVEKLTDLSAGYDPQTPFNMFLVPASGSTVELGDVIVVSATLPYGGDTAGDVPVVVGDWSPVIFRTLAAGAIDLTEVDVYVAPIAIN